MPHFQGLLGPTIIYDQNESEIFPHVLQDTEDRCVKVNLYIWEVFALTRHGYDFQMSGLWVRGRM